MIEEIVARYLEIFPDERLRLKGLLLQTAKGDKLNDRTTLPGHITASGMVFSPDRTKLLLVHHNFFGKWLQPGGHWEADDPSPWAAARREVEEETGVHIEHRLAAISPDMTIPLDIGVHPIPARSDKAEPAHDHYDFRYVFVAKSEDLHIKDDEVSAAEWMTLDDPRTQDIAELTAKLREFIVPNL